jgi:hypothetical protein
MKTKNQRIIGFSVLAILALMLSACGGGKSDIPTPTPVDPNLIAAQAIATFSMGLTQTAVANPTATATLTAVPTSTGTFAPVNTNTPGSAPTSTCYVAEFVSDVTFPDGSLVAPGQQFDKTWRVKNIGTCEWKPTFMIVYSYGAGQLGSVPTPLGKTVKPNETVEITVEMTAPNAPGSYVSAWFIKADSGEIFRKMTIDIKVVGAASTGTETPTETPIATQ